MREFRTASALAALVIVAAAGFISSQAQPAQTVLRESNLRLLESVPRLRWVDCYGVHEVRGRQTVEEFVRLEAAHDLNHLRQIDRILDRVW